LVLQTYKFELYESINCVCTIVFVILVLPFFAEKLNLFSLHIVQFSRCN